MLLISGLINPLNVFQFCSKCRNLSMFMLFHCATATQLFIPTLSGTTGLTVQAVNMNHPPHTHINTPPSDIQRVKPPPPTHTHTSLPLHLSLCHPRCCYWCITIPYLSGRNVYNGMPPRPPPSGPPPTPQCVSVPPITKRKLNEVIAGWGH